MRRLCSFPTVKDGNTEGLINHFSDTGEAIRVFGSMLDSVQKDEIPGLVGVDHFLMFKAQLEERVEVVKKKLITDKVEPFGKKHWPRGGALEKHRHAGILGKSSARPL